MTLRTSDGLDLAGWYVRSRNGAAVISYPTREGKLPQARMLVRHGYGVLLLDARGYDGSQGDPNLFGWDDDARTSTPPSPGCSDSRTSRDGRIGGIGFSVGGEMMLRGGRRPTRPARSRLRGRRRPLGPRGPAARTARLVRRSRRQRFRARRSRS